jgi:conjugal transfer pilus assembly protein TraK
MVLSSVLIAVNVQAEGPSITAPGPASPPEEINSGVTENRAEFDAKMRAAVKVPPEQRGAENPGPPPPSQPAPPEPGERPKQAPPEPVEKPKNPKEARRASSAKYNQYDFVTVLPEIAQAVELSNTDINRFICTDTIQDVVYSKEKGVVVKFSGNNAFVKFQIVLKRGEEVYASRPTELYIVCGSDVYNVIGVPKKIPAQTIKLSSGKKDVIKKNMGLFEGLPMEKKVMALIKYVHTDTIPESFEVQKPRKKVRLFKALNMILKRTVLVEGEGLLLKEYYVENTGEGLMVLNEGLFLKPEVTSNAVAIAIGDGKMNLNKDETTRLYVVELTDGGVSFVKN